MYQRLKLLRKSLNLSQAAFGSKLGVSRDVINNIENGRVELKELMVKSISSLFSIDENWLRTGNGNMYIESDDSIFKDFAQKYHLSPSEQEIARYCLSLTSDQRSEILKHIVHVAEIIKATDSEKKSDSALNAFPMPTISPNQNTNKVKPSNKKISTEMKEAILNAELTDEKRVKMS